MSPAPLRLELGTIIAALLLLSACGDDEGVSYKTDIRPLLQARCVVCHGDDNPLSLTDPFHPDKGLFVVENTWFEGHGGLEYNVVPYDPESSFLLEKISDEELIPANCDRLPEGVECAIFQRGLFMPPNPPPATADQIAAVRRWIDEEGAQDTPHFRERVVPFFGKSGDVSCSRGGYARGCVPCITCHYQDGPVSPNLSVPKFDDENLTTQQQDDAVAQWLSTIVGVKANFRSDLDLVTPGDADASFLFMKLTAEGPTSTVGARMPLGFEPLSADQVDMLRRWILEGARNN